MGKIFFDIALSLDGFMAGDHRGPQNPIGDGGTLLHNWMYNQKAFLKIHGEEGGEEGTDSKLIEDTFSRTYYGVKKCLKKASLTGRKIYTKQTFMY